MDTVIVGGGIVGASVAYHLSEAGEGRVVVCEAGEPVSETTPWSVASFKAMGDAAHLDMRRDALRLYNEFLADPRGEPWYDLIGQLIVATTDEYARRLRRAADEGPDRTVLSDDVYLPGDEIAAELVVPDLDTEAAVGGLYRPYTGYFDAEELAYEFVERARENGVEFRTHTPVREVVVEGDRAVGVETDDGRLDADEVVCAAGPWNAKLARSVGLDLPIRHTVAYAVEVEPRRRGTHVLPKINHRETGGGFRGDRDGVDVVYRTGPTGNPGEYYEESEERDPDALVVDTDSLRKDLLSDMGTLLPYLEDATLGEENVGLLSRTPDGHPIVGRTDLDGFSIAALHAEGIQLAPGIGKTIAAELLGRDPPSYAGAVSPARFADGVEVSGGHGGWG